MDLSSSRFKAATVSFGLSFWFFIISKGLGIFSIEVFTIFVIVTVISTQIFVKRLSKILDEISLFNTKIFLGLIFSVVFVYFGILFKILKIDILRIQKQSESYWLEKEDISNELKQY